MGTLSLGTSRAPFTNVLLPGSGERLLRRLFYYQAKRLGRLSPDRIKERVGLRLSRWLQPPIDHNQLILRPCGILGRAGPRLTESQRAIIASIIDRQRTLWTAGGIPPPREMNVYATATGSVPKSVAIVMPRFINCDSGNIDHDIAYNVACSAEAAGARLSCFDAGAITYRGTGGLRAEIDRLKAFLSVNRPEIVAFDGNFVPNGRTIDADLILELKREFGFKFLSIIGDCYDTTYSDCLGYWHRAADLSVIFHRNSRYFRALKDKTRVMVCPTIPIYAEGFSDAHHRDIDIGYCGGDRRQRRTYMAALADAGLKTECKFINRLRGESYSREEYNDLLGRSKLAFNNGWIRNGESIMTGRIGEVLTSGALLIEEDGSAINDYLVPFVHYVPVANVAQFVCFSQFLAENDEVRSAIARDGQAFWREHYSGDRFWQAVAQRCA
jgi:hypothetical protein